MYSVDDVSPNFRTNARDLSNGHITTYFPDGLLLGFTQDDRPYLEGASVSVAKDAPLGPIPIVEKMGRKLIHACLSNIRSSRSRSHRPKRAATPTGSVAN